MFRWDAKMIWLAMFCSVLGAPIVLAQGGVQQIRLPEYGIEFEIPATFDFDEEFAAEDVDASHVYLGDTTGDGYYDTEINIRPIGEPMNQVMLTRSMLPPGSDHIEILRRRWNGLVINATRVTEVIEGEQYVYHNVLYPILPQGVGIGVGSVTESEEAVKQLSQSILESLVGQTNWVPGGAAPAQAPSPTGAMSKAASEWRMQVLVSAALGGVVLTGLIYSLWWRKFPRGVFFILAVVIFSIGRSGASTAQDQSLFVLLSNAVFMTMGLTGFAFGILDMFRRRKPKAPKNAPQPAVSEKR